MDVTESRRKALRLRDYDYRQSGSYFITLCIHRRTCLLGEVIDDAVQLSPAGKIVSQAWFDLPDHYLNVTLDALVIMPNHVHGIICLENVEAGLWVNHSLRSQPARHALAEIVRALKTFSSRQINILRGSPGAPVWQRNYYEHVIRDDAELLKVRQYIANNPAQWALDVENPVRNNLVEVSATVNGRGQV